jgi:hypothetical protein
MRAIEGIVQILLILCKHAYIHRLSKLSAAHGISTQTRERVNSETVERWAAATRVSTGKRRRD